MKRLHFLSLLFLPITTVFAGKKEPNLSELPYRIEDDVLKVHIPDGNITSYTKKDRWLNPELQQPSDVRKVITIYDWETKTESAITIHKK